MVIPHPQHVLKVKWYLLLKLREQSTLIMYLIPVLIAFATNVMMRLTVNLIMNRMLLYYMK